MFLTVILQCKTKLREFFQATWRLWKTTFLRVFWSKVADRKTQQEKQLSCSLNPDLIRL